MRKRDYLKELYKKSEEETIKILKVIAILKKRDNHCEFVCNCGNKHTKSISQILDYTGFKCIECMGTKKWSEKKIYNYFAKYILLWNIVQLSICDDIKNYEWKIPLTKWWKKYHSKFRGIISSPTYDIKWKDLYKRYNLRLKRSKLSKEELIETIKVIYDKEGIEGLILTNLNKNHISLDGIIRKYEKEETDEPKLPSGRGYPDEWCCEKLNILEERKEYLKNNFPIETDTFEELCELHIKPFLNELKEKNKNNILFNPLIISNETFNKNNGCGIYNVYKKIYKKKISDVRKYFNLPEIKIMSMRGIICDSIPETIFDNFIYLFTNIDINNLDKKYFGGLYPKDFRHGKKKYDYYLGKSKCDKNIIVEIWMHEKNDKNIDNYNKKKYLSTRILKEEYWSNKVDTIFIGIEQSKLNSDTTNDKVIKYLTELLSPHINILDTPNNINIMFPNKSEEEIFFENCEVHMLINDGLLIYNNFDGSMKKKINKYGGIVKLRKDLYGDNYEIMETKHKERTKLLYNTTISERTNEEKDKMTKKRLKTFNINKYHNIS